ncbi:MAG: anaerobic ribonucleoside-triphosphate reductase activating protein [Alloprevotella sp.]|nr:anaerobic ribonucleoside-triphosphate reductase activating protein [Prevotella sp.]MBR1712776.1 anaerobic ribonucleoside-triphosphate reductase activating protein [Alloprevotella sp.]
MLKYVNHDIVFQEFPDEVTLAINLSLCPNFCPGCHSPYLCGDHGEELTEERLCALLEDYAGEVTCVGLMGGDNDPQEVERLCALVKQRFPGLKTGWYSGRQELPEGIHLDAFNYVKVGPYREDCGPLKNPDTNQRLYRTDGYELTDITNRFWKK